MSKTKLCPPDFKEQTQNLTIQEMVPPKEVILPLSQHTGSAAVPKVSLAEKVCVGTPVASAAGYVSSSIHSSVSGTIKHIGPQAHPVLGQNQAIVIESDAEDILDSAIKDRQDVDGLSPDEIRKIIRDSGIVGLGGAAFPTHVKLALPRDKSIDTFIVNGAECEPYLTADYRLMLEKTKEIVAGIKIAMKTLDVNVAFVAIEENKPDAIAVFKRHIDHKTIKLISIKSFYPQGAEKQLIKAILRREVPPGGLPFDVGVVVNNVATCLAVYEAVYQNKPLYERVLTVSGKIVKKPGNLKVRIGTKVKDILQFCGGLTEEPTKVVLGGPMMGIAQYTLDVPIIKGTSGIIVFSKDELKASAASVCIRCAKCIQVCPMGLNPSLIALAIEKERFDLAREYNCLDCIECGICSYICPGKRNFIDLVKLAKQRIKQK